MLINIIAKTIKVGAKGKTFNGCELMIQPRQASSGLALKNIITKNML